MVKRRKESTQEANMEAFIAAADGGDVTEHNISSGNSRRVLDPNGSRDFKTVTIPFNEYEFRKLEYACTLTGRSKNSLIRYLVVQRAKQLEKEDNN